MKKTSQYIVGILCLLAVLSVGNSGDGLDQQGGEGRLQQAFAG